MRRYKDLNIVYQGGDLEIHEEDLNSLDRCPHYITGDFRCYANKLTTLVGGPQQVDGDYDCSYNRLTSLEGCASHIGDELLIYDNKITSLVGIHKIIKSCSSIEFDCFDITEGGIGFILIDNLTAISNYMHSFKIIEKYLGTGTKGMMACRDELIANGYEDYAKL